MQIDGINRRIFSYLLQHFYDIEMSSFHLKKRVLILKKIFIFSWISLKPKNCPESFLTEIITIILFSKLYNLIIRNYKIPIRFDEFFINMKKFLLDLLASSFFDAFLLPWSSSFLLVFLDWLGFLYCLCPDTS